VTRVKSILSLKDCELNHLPKKSPAGGTMQMQDKMVVDFQMA
jgi:hypothetical protein